MAVDLKGKEAAFLRLFNSNTSETEWEDTFAMYHKDACFVDPMTSVYGVANVRLVFKGLRQYFVPYHVISHKSVPDPANNRLLIEADVLYYVLRLLPVRIRQFTILKVDPATNTIILHRDMWCILDSIRETIPRLYETVTSTVGVAQLALVKATNYVTGSSNLPKQKEL
eukprot:comp23484_c0_seq1/m.39275 comp23484_c0_seq1/g.39275  ORF comp23484_c0_seq1/g.39275 comp23484_c0_seq1/m.39275 type:complete len:169 (-) comp23484_c0_seq1:403-909(-)